MKMIFLVLLAGGCLHSDCDKIVWSEQKAPSGDLKATVSAVTCGTASGFRVEVAPLATPRSVQTIVAAMTRIDATAPGNENVITVEWLGPRKLRVTYPDWIAQTRRGLAPVPKNEPDYGVEVEYQVAP